MSKPRRALQLVLVLLVAVGMAGCREPELQFANGGSGDFADWHGQWLVVNYWAEWCAPCRVEIPELNELEQRPDVAVVGVNFDGIQGPELTQSVTKMGIEFTVLTADPGPRWQLELPEILPTTLLVSPKGELVEVRRGPQTLSGLLEAMGLLGATDHEGVAELPPEEPAPKAMPSADKPDAGGGN